MPSLTHQLKRRLKPRHIIMIAISGSIGSGMFISSGNAISTAGPGGAMVAYLLIGFMVYYLMTSLGEMSALLPTTGSFCDYSTRFIEPAFGFAMGYAYWFNWSITMAVDLIAGAMTMHFWFPHISEIYWTMLFFIFILLTNVIAVGIYGEVEYWFSVLKVFTVILFIFVGILMLFGLFNGHQAVNFSYWRLHDAPFHAGWFGLMNALIVAGFSFQGSEVFGITAGEVKDPKKTLPKAMKTIFWRILIFYILSLFIMTVVIPYTDPSLLNSDVKQVALSPFVLVFKIAGLHGAANFINLVILIAVLSTANASFYTATRTLWYISKQHQAPHFLSYVNKRGVPIISLIITALLTSVVFLSSKFGHGVVFIWLLNISGLAGFIAWIGIALSHYRFRRAYLMQNRPLDALPYRAQGFPFGALFSLLFCVLVLIGQQFVIIFNHTQSINWGLLIGTDIGIPIFFLLYFGYKFYKKSKLINLKDCSFEIEHQTN